MLSTFCVGLGGLATALALKNLAGIENVKVWERADEMRWKKAGSITGLGISVNGLRAIQCISPQAHNDIMEAGMWSEVLQRQYIRWSTLRNILASYLPAETVAFGMEVVAIADEGDVVHLISRDGQRAEAPVVVAADGIRSIIKRLISDSSRSVRATESGGTLREEVLDGGGASLQSTGS